MIDPGLTLASYLAIQLGSPWALGTNLFNGPVRPAGRGVPMRAIFVLPTGGPGSTLYREDSTLEQMFEGTIQIRIRSAHEDYAGGVQLALDVRTELHCQPPSGWNDLRIRESLPNYLGPDATGCHEWSLNAVAWIESR